jgi:hypothetical protein
MSEKPMTVTEMVRMGGIARAKAHSKAELRAWDRRGGRPAKLERKALVRLRKLLASGMTVGRITPLRSLPWGSTVPQSSWRTWVAPFISNNRESL